MLNVLFWNLRKNSLQAIVARLARQLKLDVIILAESEGVAPADMLRELNPLGSAEYFIVPIIGCEKVVFYTRFSPAHLPAIEETHRVSIRHLQLPGLTSLLIAATHFPDKQSMSDSSQMFEAVELVQLIKAAESKIGHQRTVLVGDLNMNPFEVGMVGAMLYTR